MPQVIFDRFEAGLDLRKGASVSDANRLRVLDNAYVTTGRALKKRPCLSLFATLEAGTIGLKSGNGLLNTFYGAGAAVVHANPTFKANRVDHPSIVTPPVKVHYSDTFIGYIYTAIEYANGDIKHNYLDLAGAITWVAATSKDGGAFVQPTTPNGYKYEMTSGKVKGAVTVTIATPAVFTFVAHALAVNDPIRLTTTGALPTGLVINTTYYITNVPTADTFRVSLTVGGSDVATTGSQSGVHTLTRWRGTTGGTEPIWTTVPGTSVVDNVGASEITWTCRGMAILDTNCPNSKIVIKQRSKIYSGNGDTVRYCAVNAPRDWTSVSDAGFLPVGIQATGSNICTALGQFRKSLAVFFSDSTQVWAVDTNPSLNSLTSNVENVGTKFSKTPSALSGDLLFLAENGIRSVSVITLTDNFQDTDIGSPIDLLIQANVLTTADPVSIYYPGLGQYWCVDGAKIYVYSFSRTSKVAGWSTYTLPFAPDDMTILSSKLYIRKSNNVYLVDNKSFTDFGTPPQITVSFPYLDCKSPGILKQFLGIDVVYKGTANIAYAFDSRNTSLVTDSIQLSGDTRPDSLAAVELCAVSIAPIITHKANEDFQLDAFSLYYENLGTV